MTLLAVDDLKTWFTIEKSWKPGAADKVLKAVDGISFAIEEGEVLSVVGESGCGKSTVGRTLTKLEAATGGTASLSGKEFLSMSNAEFRPLRQQIQMIFQDPFASLNPRMTIEQTVSEPLKIHGLAQSNAEIRPLIADMLSKVGLDPRVMKRFPHEFSGGQRQRIAIARVMILSPSLIIADEPVSALDVSIQAQVLNLLKKLQSESGVAMLFISHDLGVVRLISDRVAVMYLGRIVEIGPKANIFNNPSHPYTQLLLDSIPQIDPAKRAPKVATLGEPASAANPPSGCAFHPRCPYASKLCSQAAPELQVLESKHQVACHHVGQFERQVAA